MLLSPNLHATLSQALHSIRNPLAKFDGLAGARLEDYFELAFEALSHRIIATDKFEAAVLHLEKKFTGEGHTEMFFNTNASLGTGYPLHGGNLKTSSIEPESRLTHPAHTMAQFRCDEIAKTALDIFNKEVRYVLRPVEAGIVVEAWRIDVWLERNSPRLINFITTLLRRVFYLIIADLLYSVIRPRCLSMPSLFLPPTKDLKVVGGDDGAWASLERRNAEF